jgi:putative effector of murein hydrolase LrgA (UPF0299 family)
MTAQKVQQIEQTSKGIKAVQALFFVAVAVGVVWSFSAPSNASISTLFIGLIGFLAARVVAWWRHG